MAIDPVVNFGKVTVSTTYDDVATQIVLTGSDGAKLPAPATAGEFNLVWWDSTTYPDPSDDPNVEIVRCTARSTDTLTVTRAQESTAASTKNTGGKTYLMILAPTAKTITEINKIVAIPPADHSVSGITVSLPAAQEINFGDVCYIAPTGKMSLVDADSISSGSGLVLCADTTIAINGTGAGLLLGTARDDSWNWTVGSLIYITTTATTGNTLSQTRPTGTDDVVQIVGVATHADRILFNPSLVQVELV